MSSIFADTLVYRNGTFAYGKVISQDTEVVEFQTEEGKFLKVEKKRILKVFFQKLNAQEVQQFVKTEQEKQKPTKTSNQKQPENLEAPPSRWSYVWRSAVLPGFGQYHAGETKMGIGIGILFFLSAGYAYTEQEKYTSAQQDYVQTTLLSNVIIPNPTLTPQANGQPDLTPVLTRIVSFAVLTSGPESNYRASVTNYNNASAVVGIVYAAQLLHSYFLGKKKEKEFLEKKTAFSEEQKGDWFFRSYADGRDAFSTNWNLVNQLGYSWQF